MSKPRKKARVPFSAKKRHGESRCTQPFQRAADRKSRKPPPAAPANAGFTLRGAARAIGLGSHATLIDWASSARWPAGVPRRPPWSAAQLLRIVEARAAGAEHDAELARARLLRLLSSARRARVQLEVAEGVRIERTAAEAAVTRLLDAMVGLIERLPGEIVADCESPGGVGGAIRAFFERECRPALDSILRENGLGALAGPALANGGAR